MQPRNPHGIGGFKKGDPARNPGGLTVEEREARDILRKALAAPKFRDAWQEAYFAAIEERNPVILKDYADRVLGKAKEMVEVEWPPEGVAVLTGVKPEVLTSLIDYLQGVKKESK